jgi:uncharacterized lipoprotein NlpE involved in copper resistance
MKKLLIAIIVVVLFGSVLVGCTNRDNNNATPTGTVRPVAPTATVSPAGGGAATGQPTVTTSPLASPDITGGTSPGAQGDATPNATVSPVGSPDANQ